MKQVQRPNFMAKGSKSSVQITEDWLSMGNEPDEYVSPPKKEGGAYVEGAIKLSNLMECPSEIMCLKYHNGENNILAVGLCDGSIKIIDPLALEFPYILHLSADQTNKASRLPVTSMHFLQPPEEQVKAEHRHVLLSTYASGCVRIWNYRSSTCSKLIQEPSHRQILACAVNADGSKFLTAGSDDKIYIYDMKTQKHLRTCEPSDSRHVMNGHKLRVFALQYHPEHHREFISGGWDDVIMFWEDRTKHSVRKSLGPGPHICGNDGFDIDPVHNHILTGSWRKDKSLQIWDYDTGQLIKDVPYDTLHTSQGDGHIKFYSGSKLYCAKWLGKSYMACGGSDENMARVIDRGTLNTVGQLVDLEKGVVCMDSCLTSGSAPRLAVGAGHFIYNLELAKTI